MTELIDTRARVRLNEAKLKVLNLCKEQTERSLFALAECLARDGYTKDKIIQAIEATRPNFEESVAAALRTVTILDMLSSAGDG